jgi:hypothetical protein
VLNFLRICREGILCFRFEKELLSDKVPYCAHADGSEILRVQDDLAEKYDVEAERCVSLFVEELILAQFNQVPVLKQELHCLRRYLCEEVMIAHEIDNRA